MKIIPVKTADNSYTLFSEKFNQHYHSINGALTESQHIFINLGLRFIEKNEISILEIGYGTGLNAILSFEENKILNKKIYYHGIEVKPVEKDVFCKLGFENYISDANSHLLSFNEKWDEEIIIGNQFALLKQIIDIQSFTTTKKYDIIYFDAFSPEVQPEMWTVDIFSKLSTILLTGGILVTYCSKGIVKENLRNSGFFVKRFEGPPGKRHVIRATKL